MSLYELSRACYELRELEKREHYRTSPSIYAAQYSLMSPVRRSPDGKRCMNDIFGDPRKLGMMCYQNCPRQNELKERIWEFARRTAEWDAHAQEESHVTA